MLPEEGIGADTLMGELAAMREGDVRWEDGRAFGMVYDGGPEVHEVARRAAELYLHENALNTMAMPSLGRIQREVCAMVADMTHGGPDAAGFMTSGGTESILMAVKAARERGRHERGIEHPNLVIPESGHAAFHKAAHLFGLETRTIGVGPDWRADVDAVADAVDDNTVLVVGSAPTYPQGVIDPIADLAAIADGAGANFHTDACMGGFVLPFAEDLGHAVEPWDFRVPGVTSISADIHKLGYAPKGASVIMHRTKELRRWQTFVFDGWLGGFYASPNLQGTRPGLPMATAWAVMRRLGRSGYRTLVADTLDAATRIRAGVAGIDGLEIVGTPRWHLHSIVGTDDVDVFAVGDEMARSGWFHDRQTPPDSLHMTVSNGNVRIVDAYVRDLTAAVDAVRGTTTEDRSTNYATAD